MEVPEMKRLARIAAVALPLFTLAVAHTYADVKTREQSSMKLEGMLGKVVSFFGRGKDTPVTNTAAVKGNRKATMNDATGQIIDLSEEKIYDLDIKKKEYRVTTFEQIRQKMREEAERARKQQEREEPHTEKGEPQKPTKEYEVDFDVKDTGQKKPLIGYDTHETIVTVTVREKGKTLEESGGVVLTTDMWLAPRIPELKELADFDVRYWKQLQEGTGIPTISPEQMAQVMALFPLFAKASERMQKDGDKLNGTALDSTMTFESVKSHEQMTEQQSSSSGSSGGGGIGGLLAKKMMKKNNADAGSPRATVFTMHHTFLEVSKSVAAGDLSIPPDFKEKK
jgi:hypothetical protein